MIEKEVLEQKMAGRIGMYEDGIRKRMEALIYGTRHPDTATFVKWFEAKLRERGWYEQQEDFAAGRADIKRYNEAKAKEYEAVGYGLE